MNCLIKNIIFFLIVIASHIICISQSYSQIQKIEDITYTGIDYLVEKNFEYKLNKKDTIRHGKYILELKPIPADTFLVRSYLQKKLTVTYQNDLKDGPVDLLFYDFTPDFSSISIDNKHILIQHQGELYSNKGQYSNNIPVGHWSFKKLSLNGTETPDTLITSESNFLPNGLLSGPYTISNISDSSKIDGLFSKDGFFDDIWTVTNQDAPYLQYVFESGKLISIDLLLDSLRNIFIPIHSDTNNFETVQFDSVFIDFVNISLLNDLPTKEHSIVNKSLHSILASLDHLSLKYAALSDYFPDNIGFQYPFVRLPVFELSSEKRSKIKKLHKKLSNLDSNLDGFKANQFIQSYKKSEPEIASLYTRALLIEDLLIMAKSISSLLEQPVSRHIDINEHVNKTIKSFSGRHTLEYATHNLTAEEEIFIQPAPQELDALNSFEYYVQTIDSLYNSTQKELEERKEQVRLNRELIDNEKKLTQLTTDIHNIVDTLFLPLYSLELESNYKKSFISFTEKRLEQYQSKSIEERTASAVSLISCLEKVKQQLEESHILVHKKRLVDEAYMEKRLNPYTYTETNVRINEKLFRAYNEKMIPFLVNNITPAPDCNTFLNNVRNIEIVQDFMLKAKKNGITRKLERQIRHNDSPETIIRKLNIPLL